MPFSEHSTDDIPGSRRGARGRPTARDASIDEILKSIQQIIDEEPLTTRNADGDEFARGADRSAPRRSSMEVAPYRKRPARPIRATAPDDDVLAELLAPSDAPSEHPIATEQPAHQMPPVAATHELIAATIDAMPAPIETEFDPPIAEPAAEIIALDPVPAPAIVAKAEPEHAPAPTISADALLQSLAASLAAGGFVDDHSAPAIVELHSGTSMPASEPEVDELKLSPEATAAAAVAAVAAAAVNAAPTANADAAPIAEAVEPIVASEPVGDAAPIEAETSILSALPPALAEGLDDAIATMLRPLLREWLDAHLPRMVEKALKEELRERPLAATARSNA